MFLASYLRFRHQDVPGGRFEQQAFAPPFPGKSAIPGIFQSCPIIIEIIVLGQAFLVGLSARGAIKLLLYETADSAEPVLKRSPAR